MLTTLLLHHDNIDPETIRDEPPLFHSLYLALLLTAYVQPTYGEDETKYTLVLVVPFRTSSLDTPSSNFHGGALTISKSVLVDGGTKIHERADSRRELRRCIGEVRGCSFEVFAYHLPSRMSF